MKKKESALVHILRLSFPQAVLIALKLTHVIDWSWKYVLLPLKISLWATLIVCVIAIFGTLADDESEEDK